MSGPPRGAAQKTAGREAHPLTSCPTAFYRKGLRPTSQIIPDPSLGGFRMSTALPLPPGPDDSANHDQTAMTDLVLAGRHVSSGQFIAGLLAAAQLSTVGTPRKLGRDVWPDVDPAVVEEIYQRGVAVGFRAGGAYALPRFHGAELVRLRAQLEEAGFVAMAGMVGRSLRLLASPAAEGDGVPEATES